MENTYEKIYEDKNIIVVSKKESVLVIKGRGSLSAEENLYEKLNKEYGKIFVVHRIDRDTSGVLVFAKDKQTHRELSIMFEKRLIDKRYLAVVYGNFKEKFLSVDLPIREYGSQRMGVSQNGKPATTEFRLIKNLDNNLSLIEAKPITGRRHQIRVHLYHIGYPIVGDKLYGRVKDRENKYGRMMLHCFKLEFTLFGKKYSFEEKESFLKICFSSL
ncbi:MAG: RluA family pseudouridine synthase [Elusimicrobiota bacterium]